MSDDLTSFEAFMKQREEAAKAYVVGDAAPLSALSTSQLPATFFSPKGDYKEGAENVLSTYQNDASVFESAGETHFEILHMAASDGIGYWVGFQKAMVNMKGQDKPIPFNLRITEIYRREGDSWKMIHRHADQLKSE